MNKNRILSLWFPYLSIEIFFRSYPDSMHTPFSIISTNNKKKTLDCLNIAAKSMGLKIGMSLHDAYAICPNLITKEKNIQIEYDYIKTLARWCHRFTPRVSIENSNLLLLNITGCSNLFKGEKTLIKKIITDLQNMKLSAYHGVANTSILASAIAKFGHNRNTIKTNDLNEIENFINSKIITTHAQFIKSVQYESKLNNKKQIIPNISINQVLANMPIEALNLNQITEKELNYLGITRVNDLKIIPHKILASRFGTPLVNKLKKALEIENEIIPTIKEKKFFSCKVNLLNPTLLESDLLKILQDLITKVCAKLETEHCGTKQLRVILSRVSNSKKIIHINSIKITHNPNVFIKLSELSLNKTYAQFGIDSIRVVAVKTYPLSTIQYDMKISEKKIDHISKDFINEETKNLIFRLGLKMCLYDISYLHPSKSHIPEKDTKLVAAIYASPVKKWPAPKNLRPTLLFKPESIKIFETTKSKELPKIFLWRHKKYYLKDSMGPERITPEWWLDNPEWRSGIRDYWRIDSTCGARLWLFEAKAIKHENGWFVQGNFV